MSNHIFELSDRVKRAPVRYRNRFGIELAGELYVAKDLDETTAHPALVIGPPYGGVKEQGPGVYANQLAQRGFVVLTFDPSFCGESAGEPHHLSSPELFAEDFSAGVDYLGLLPFVDRDQIGALGICGSGGFALAAAEMGPRIKAVATASMYDIARMFKDATPDAPAALAAIAEQRWEDAETGSPAMSERTNLGDLDELDPVNAIWAKFYSRPRGYHPNATTQFTISSTAPFLTFNLLDHLDFIAPRPIMMIVGENAHSRYFSEDVVAAAPGPVTLVDVPGADHVDLYDRTDLIPFDTIEQFFKNAFAA